MSATVLPAVLSVPATTLSGAGTALKFKAHVVQFGPRVMLVHGRSLEASGRIGEICESLAGQTTLETYTHTGSEPTLNEVTQCLGAMRAFKPDCVVAVGGGSVMDLAKAAAGLVNAPLSVNAYHGGEPLPRSSMPFIAVPTTAGTGSEATSVSVLSDTERGLKKSIRDPSHLPRVVVLDPVLLRDCPDTVLAASGMDAFTQAVEAYMSRGATWFTDALALQAAEMVIRNLLHITQHRDSADSRYLALLQGSYMAGLALSHSRLGLVHGLAHPLGYRYHAPHGLVCGVCLPAVLRFNREAAAEKFDLLSARLGQDALALTESALSSLRIVSPFAGQPLDDRAAIIKETLASGSTQANPRLPNEQDVSDMLDTLFA